MKKLYQILQNSVLFISLLSIQSQWTYAANEIVCDKQIEFDFEKEIKKIGDVLSKVTLKNGFYQTGYNLKIDEDCSKRVKISELEKFYRATMAEGTMCLSKLSQYGKLGNENNACLLKLFEDKQNPPKILCGGWPFCKDIYAVGSFPGSSKRHPYLWLSPSTTQLMKTDPRELKATIFHEMLHNCGFTHSEGIEVTYTCEECCFNKSLSKDKLASACKICAGKYENEYDIEYQKDLINWSKDYPGWGKDMRQQVYMAATKSKSLESFNLLLDQVTQDASEREALTLIFKSPDENSKKKLALEFEEKFKNSIAINPKLSSLSKWNLNKSDAAANCGN